MEVLSKGKYIEKSGEFQWTGDISHLRAEEKIQKARKAHQKKKKILEIRTSNSSVSPPVLSIHRAIGWMSGWMQQEVQGGSDGQESLEVQWSREMGVSLELRKGRALLLAQSVKKLPAVRETWVRIPGLRRSLGGGHGKPLQYSCLENPMDRGTWWFTVHGVAKSQTQLSD